MQEKTAKRISKFLSLVLRHKPETIGIELDNQGWTEINVLLQKMNQAGRTIDREILNEVVRTNSKQRFAISSCGSRIRANQGHSLDVDLAYQASTPPDCLYHGAPHHAVEMIDAEGLKKMQRHHVHLNDRLEPCVHVAQRRGRPVIYQIQSKQMHQDGHEFYLSANGVWLTDHVPAQYLQKIDERLT